MTKDEALDLALEALTIQSDRVTEIGKKREAITAIKQARSAPVQEPTIEDNSQDWAGMDGATAWHLIDRHADGWADVAKMMGEWLAANTSPAAQPAPVQEPVAWVDSVMTQAQVFASAWALVGSRFDSGNEMENAEQQKKELRAMLTTPPAAPVQEPVWIQPDHLQKAKTAPFLCRVEPHKRDDFVPLYITPPAAQRQWVGLTDEEIQAEWLLTPQHDKAEGIWFGRRLEAKLKEKNNG